MKLSEQIKQCIDGNGCAVCDYMEYKITHTCKGLLQAAYEQVKKYEDMFPCNIGDTVYVLAECGKISKQLDGTLYSSDGSFGTATGYYCPYEDNCPFDGEDFDSCEKYKNHTAVFEDTVSSITIDEYAVYVTTKNCGVCSEIGRFVFLTKEQAKEALKKNKELGE